MSVRVILADDHPIVRQGLRALLESEPDFEVVAETGDGQSVLKLTEQHHPDVLIVDLMMPVLNGLEVTRTICKRYPGVQVIVLSMHRDEAYVRQALRYGARGYVIKDTGPGELVDAIHAISMGYRYLSPPLVENASTDLLNLPPQEFPEDPYDQLTTREREVLQLVVEGSTSAEVARRLSISPRTAELHRANLMHKLGLQNQRDLIRFAIKRGILSIDE